MATKKDYSVKYEGKSYAVKAYSPKQAKLIAGMKNNKGYHGTFAEMNKRRKAFMLNSRIAG